MTRRLVLPRPSERYDPRLEAERNLLIERAVSQPSDAAPAPAWGDITGTLADQTDLDARFTAVEGDVATAQGDIATLQGDVANLAANQPTIAVVSADVTTTLVSPSRAIVSALTIPVVAGKRYKVKFVLAYNTDNANTGLALNLNRVTANNAYAFVSQISAGSVSGANRVQWAGAGAGTGFGANDFFSSFGHTSAVGTGLYVAEGILFAAASDGQVELHIAVENGATGTVTVLAGSYVEYQALP